MSTKIYNAFILDMDLAETLRYLRDKTKAFIRSPRFLDAIRDAQFSKLANLCFEAKVDCLETGKSVDDVFGMAFDSILPLMSEMRDVTPKPLTRDEFRKDPLRWSRELVKELTIRNEKEIVALNYDDDCAFNLNATVFPYGKKTIGMLFGGQAKMMSEDRKISYIIDEFTKFADLADFSYWDCTDRPDDISEEEWDARKKAWDESIPSWVPSNDGYGYTIFSAVRGVLPKLTMPVAESLYNKHRENLVKTYAGYLFERRELDKRPKGVEEELTMSEASRMLIEIHERKAAGAPEYLEAVQTMEDVIPDTFAQLLADVGAAETDTAASSILAGIHADSDKVSDEEDDM